MNKRNYIYFILVFLIAFSSCARLINATTQNRKQQNPRTNGNRNNNNTAPQNTGGYSTQYNIGSFKGTVTKDVVYKTGTNVRGMQQQLGMDIYTPANAEGKRFPLVLLMHGGSFRTGDKMDLAPVCAGLANNDYICISINYRLGWGTGKSLNTCNSDTQELKQAVYMAVQDAHAAMNYIVAHADEYSIDKNWMFIGGHSAGAIAALFTAYLSEKNDDDFFRNYSSKLGPLRAASNSNTYNFRGVLSMWGAFINPSLITSSTALPTIFFQGQKDPLVPFNTAHITRCSSTSLLYGTYPLYNRLKNLGETTIAHVDPNGGHGVFTNDFRIKNILCFLNDVKQGIKKQEYLTGDQESCN